MDEGQSVLRAQGVGKQVAGPEGTLEILSDITLQIAPSESVALVGPSGAGKSTLLAVLAGLDTPTAGEVWLGDQAITSLSEDARAQLRNARVGFVFQSFHLLPSLTAVENVMLPAELAGTTDARERALAALDAVDLSHRARHYPKHLSGGERQRVAIARAFVTEPQLLFADEPTGNLDTRTGQRVADLLFRLQHDSGVTLVLVTHDDRLAQRCDRVLRLVEGRLAEADA
ncbi:MAG: ABC transporter ATP-binding protein [Pseudomonadota bacterium]